MHSIQQNSVSYLAGRKVGIAACLRLQTHLFGRGKFKGGQSFWGKPEYCRTDRFKGFRSIVHWRRQTLWAVFAQFASGKAPRPLLQLCLLLARLGEDRECGGVARADPAKKRVVLHGPQSGNVICPNWVYTGFRVRCWFWQQREWKFNGLRLRVSL